MEHYKSIPRLPEHNTGPVEDDPEYKLILQANNLITDIDSDILVVHKFLRDHYATRFPELEQLVPAPYDFARAIRAIGAEPDLTKADLRSTLPPATVMIVSVTATTSNGRPLAPEKLGKIMEAVDMLLALEDAKRKVYDYVESRMAFLAPNMTVLVGASTAAKLMGAAGGLTALSKIPASNLQVIGANKRTNTGLSILGQERHRGFIYYSDMVSAIPTEFRMKATRILAAKATLAARIDCVREAADGHQGQRLREEVEKKIEKMLEPPPGKSIKPLAAPIEHTSKKRGGRRIRKMKQQYVMTEVRKAANRMAFNVAEEEAMFMDSSEGLGILGNTGKVRMKADERVKGGNDGGRPFLVARLTSLHYAPQPKSTRKSTSCSRDPALRLKLLVSCRRSRSVLCKAWNSSTPCFVMEARTRYRTNTFQGRKRTSKLVRDRCCRGAQRAKSQEAWDPLRLGRPRPLWVRLHRDRRNLLRNSSIGCIFLFCSIHGNQ